MPNPTLTDKQRTPPAAVAKAAAQGLKLREEHGRGGTEIGRRRARQLENREPISERDIKAIYSYFARHTVDKQGKGWADADRPSAGYIAWLLWGGEPGKAWIDTLHARLDDAAD
ncbi:hypothetical protein BZG35_06410 [Brevundimonas sp. LM2]|uniref:hypothetical protein n=1 Tax=Brevundimonas sp. LM2 TaxID=1938605 RepID=UPI0009840909|nr:hypothetical protein [Brevundimonas sp. LM2]AQR61324.1 hypothetical protein BZG35_06410 [Brevundimonas sp. LM2]